MIPPDECGCDIDHIVQKTHGGCDTLEAADVSAEQVGYGPILSAGTPTCVVPTTLPRRRCGVMRSAIDGRSLVVRPSFMASGHRVCGALIARF